MDNNMLIFLCVLVGSFVAMVVVAAIAIVSIALREPLSANGKAKIDVKTGKIEAEVHVAESQDKPDSDKTKKE